jgi:putative SOS response-associated peptidase YedK
MCGRYAASRGPGDLVEEFEVDDPPQVVLPADYNVAPTKEVYAVVERRRDHDGAPTVRRQLRVARWGLVPSWAKDPTIGTRLINAREETVATKPAFRKAFARRRCLLPADGYYEWWTPPEAPQGRGSGRALKQPFFIHPTDGRSLAMAGLYEFWRDPTRDETDPLAWWTTVTVLTTSAQDAVGKIHDRMPLLVEAGRWHEWLDPDLDGSADPASLTALLVPAAPGRLAAYPVSRAVNNVRNNGPELLARLPGDQVPEGAEGMLF